MAVVEGAVVLPGVGVVTGVRVEAGVCVGTGVAVGITTTFSITPDTVNGTITYSPSAVSRRATYLPFFLIVVEVPLITFTRLEVFQNVSLITMDGS